MASSVGLLALLLTSACVYVQSRMISSAICIPTTIGTIEKTEGRHKCAYDSALGYRAVGVGYNLDDKSPERQREVAAVFSSWDKVYKGEECLNDAQITTLLTLDATRAQQKAADKIPAFNNWCCNIQAVFADIAFSLAEKEWGTKFDDVIAKAVASSWDEAADILTDSKFGQKYSKETAVLAEHLRDGCGKETETLIESAVNRLMF